MAKSAAPVVLLFAMMLSGSASAADVTALGWMSGRWVSEQGERWSEEHWTAPRGGLMLGVGRSGRGAMALQFEFVRIAANEQGVPVYWASPGGGPAVPFKLVQSDRGSATFENPAHDYPVRIEYRRDGDQLIATISGQDGADRSTWQFRRLSD